VDRITGFLLDEAKRRHLSADQIARLRLHELAEEVVEEFEEAIAELSSDTSADISGPRVEISGDGSGAPLTPGQLKEIAGSVAGIAGDLASAATGTRTDEGDTMMVASTQGSSPAQANSSGSRIGASLVAGFVVCVLVAGFLMWRSGAWGPVPSASTCTTYAATQAPQVIADLVATVGDTQVTSVTVGCDFATVVAPSTPGATTTDSFSWQDGTAGSNGPTPYQPTRKELTESLFDVTTVDWTLLEGLAAQVPGLTRRDDPDFSVTVKRETRGSTTVQFNISVQNSRNARQSTWITADATGRIVSMGGGDPGSPVATWSTDGFFALAPEIVDEFVAAAGTTQFKGVLFDGTVAGAPILNVDYASDPTTSKWKWFEWKNGIVSRTSGGSGGSSEPFDVAAVDWTLVGKLAAQVPGLTGLTQAEVGSLSVECHAPGTDSEQRASTPMVFVLKVNHGSGNREYTSQIVADATGKVVWMEGGAPGSPADRWAAEHP